MDETFQVVRPIAACYKLIAAVSSGGVACPNNLHNVPRVSEGEFRRNFHGTDTKELPYYGHKLQATFLTEDKTSTQPCAGFSLSDAQ